MPLPPPNNASKRTIVVIVTPNLMESSWGRPFTSALKCISGGIPASSIPRFISRAFGRLKSCCSSSKCCAAAIPSHFAARRSRYTTRHGVSKNSEWRVMTRWLARLARQKARQCLKCAPNALFKANDGMPRQYAPGRASLDM